MPGGVCAIALCKSRPNRPGTEKLRFFGFPKDAKIRGEWIKRCKKIKDFDPTNKRVCHKHFLPEDYEDALYAEMLNRNPKRLKRTAVPSLFLPPEESDKFRKVRERDERAKKKERKRLVEEILKEDELKSKKELVKETKAKSKQKLDVLDVRCFICDKYLMNCDFVDYSREGVAQVITKLLEGADHCVMVIKDDDYMCGTCQELVLRICRLETELRSASLALRALLRIKYSIDFVNVEPQELVCPEGQNELKPATTLTSKDCVPKLPKPLKNRNALIPKKILRHKKVGTTQQKVASEELKIEVVPCTIGYIQSLSVDCFETMEEEVKPWIEGNVESTQADKQHDFHYVNVSKIKGDQDFEVKEVIEENGAINSTENESNDQKKVDVGTDSPDMEWVGDGTRKIIKKMYKCGGCTFKSFSHDALTTHFQYLKEKNGHYCSICDFLFHRRNLCKLHLQSHAKESENRSCIFCHAKIHDRLHMKFHIIKHHKKHTIYTCQQCNKSFVYKRSLKVHNSKIHKKESSVMRCEKCKLRFFDKIKLKKHTEYSHRKNLNCKFCAKPISNLEKLFKHEYLHKYGGKATFQCSYCPQTFIRKAKLLSHEMQHSDNLPFKCEVCGLGFYTETAYNNHKSRHSKTELNRNGTMVTRDRIMCEVCGKTFSTRTMWAMHRLLHDNPHPYECDICHKKFRYNNKIRKHKLRFHSEIIDSAT